MDAQIYDAILKEHFDCDDRETRRAMITINENDQNEVLKSLTSKLYDHIVNKVDDIDFGSIPDSKGDISKIEKFDQMLDCVDVIRTYLIEAKQDTSNNIDIIDEAIENLAERTDVFRKGFSFDVEFIMVTYSSLALAVVSSISFMITSAIEFIKEPNSDSFTITVDKVALQKTQNNLLFNNLKKFNASCKKGEFDKAMDYIFSSVDKKIHESISVASGVVAGVAIAGILMNIIPIIRELIFFFYHSRVKISDYFETQADLLQINAYNIQSKPNLDTKSKKSIADKQMKIVVAFRKIANTFAIDSKQAELKATKDLQDSKKKYKVEDLVDSKPDSAPTSNSSSLF
jgi:hypothetical protein